MNVSLLPLLFTFIGLGYGFSGHTQLIQFDLVSPPKDEPWARIHGMVQDAQSFLWLATDDGLFKYDGYKCAVYRNESKNQNSLASNWVESVAVDKDNFLLLGTYGSGLDRFDLATENFIHYRSNPRDVTTLSNDTVTAIAKDKQGMFWIGTHNGLNQFDPKSGKFTRYRNDPKDATSLSDNQVRTLFVDRNGVLWVGTKSPWKNDGGTRVGGLNRFDYRTGKFTRYLHNPANSHSLADNQITAIFEDSRGTFWVGTAGDGLHTMNRGNGQFERHSYDASHPERLSRPAVHNVNSSAVTDYITFIAEDKNNRIWIGTLNGGINVYNYSTKEVAYYGSEKNSKEKLNENRFGAACISKEGIFWVASQAGNLYKVNPYRIALPFKHLGKVVADFYEDQDGVLWAATDQGIIEQRRNGEIQQYLLEKKGFSLHNVISDLEGDKEHHLWAGTLGGLYRFNTLTKRLTAYHHDPTKETTLVNDTITSLTKAKNNALWVGTANGLDLIDPSTGKFTHYRHDPNDPTSLGSTFRSDEGETSIWSTTLSSDNSLWVCVGGGVNRFDAQNNSFQKYSISDVVINTIKKDGKGAVWAGTNAGLYQYDRKLDAFVAFHDLLRIVNRKTNIVGIAEDRHHYLWLKTAGELIRLHTEKKEASVYATSGHGFGWFSRKIDATNTGLILSGDTAGYFAFDPDLILGKMPAPKIILTNFSLFDEQVNPAMNRIFSEPVNKEQQIHLKHNQNVFSFAFTSIDFTGNGEERNFLFRLEGYDKNWHQADAEQTANYYNVPPGSYTFKVKSANKNGIWAEKTISIIISPPWWTTWWAYGLYGLLFIAAIYLLHQVQKQRVLESERRRARDRELAQAKEIERAYTELKATQAQLIQKEKMASLGELTAGIAHEIQNPLNFVNNFSEINRDLIAELKDEISRGNLHEVNMITKAMDENEQKIIHHGKRADAIVKSMLEHSRASKGKKELVDINALADECLRLSYHAFRVKEKGFNVTIKSAFDRGLRKIEVVPQDISRVLLNLLNNAFYAVQEKKARFNGTYESCIYVHTRELNSKVEIEIRDNGCGIPQNIIDKIFQPFFTTKPTGEGTGLGLSLSYDIIKTHGGEIKVHSRENEGTSFVVQL